MEKAGVPVVALTYTDQETFSNGIRRDTGANLVRRIIIPRVSGQEMAAKLAKDLVPDIVKQFTTPLTADEKKGGVTPREEFPRICFTGTFDQAQEYFQGDPAWLGAFQTVAAQPRLTTGWPIILPTEEKVKWMLTGTSHKPDESMNPKTIPDYLESGIATAAFTHLEFTVETVAINCVMAGCKPEYMPIMLAAAEMQARIPPSCTGGCGSYSTGVVSGPIGKEVGMSTTAYMGKASVCPANAAMRYASALIGKNASGSGGLPDGWDYEDPTTPWTPLGVDAGFKPTENVFCGVSAASMSPNWIPSKYRQEPTLALPRIAKFFTLNLGGSSGLCLWVVPTIAADLASGKASPTGKPMTKQDVKQWLWENMTWTMKDWRNEMLYEWTRVQILRPGPMQRTDADLWNLPDATVVNRIKSPNHITIIVSGLPEEFVRGGGYGNWLVTDQFTSIDKWK
jgi:hypothetical protein